MINLPPCPKCKHEAELYQNAQAVGKITIWYTIEGVYSETDYDKVHSRGNGAIRCSYCRHIRRDLIINNNGVIIAKPE